MPLAKKQKRNKKKFVETVAVCRVLLDYNLFIAKQGIKEAAVPNIPSRKTSLWYNVNDKEKTFIIPIFIPNSQSFHFEQSMMAGKSEPLSLKIR